MGFCFLFFYWKLANNFWVEGLGFLFLAGDLRSKIRMQNLVKDLDDSKFHFNHFLRPYMRNERGRSATNFIS